MLDMKWVQDVTNGNVHSKGKERSAKGEYVLATGSAAANRLRILHRVYGPGALSLLSKAGIREGMRVADFGCGVGMVTQLLADLVGPSGEVVGVDFSGAQIAEARALLPEKLSHVRFVEASATSTGLESESFDLVYCRFLLIHLAEPELALREMFRLLKPNGLLACEDGDLTSAGSEPPSKLEDFAKLFGLLGPKWGVDYTLGRKLFQMVQAADFSEVDISFNQPVFAKGEEKRLLELSVAEAGPAFVAAGLITDEELHHSLSEMQRLADDERILALMPRMSQVWARKSVSSLPVAE